MDGSRSDRLSRVHARSTVLAPEISCGEFLEHLGHRTGAARGLNPRHGRADPSRSGGLFLVARGDKRRRPDEGWEGKGKRDGERGAGALKEDNENNEKKKVLEKLPVNHIGKKEVDDSRLSTK